MNGENNNNCPTEFIVSLIRSRGTHSAENQSKSDFFKGFLDWHGIKPLRFSKPLRFLSVATTSDVGWAKSFYCPPSSLKKWCRCTKNTLPTLHDLMAVTQPLQNIMSFSRGEPACSPSFSSMNFARASNIEKIDRNLNNYRQPNL